MSWKLLWVLCAVSSQTTLLEGSDSQKSLFQLFQKYEDIWKQRNCTFPDPSTYTVPKAFDELKNLKQSINDPSPTNQTDSEIPLKPCQDPHIILSSENKTTQQNPTVNMCVALFEVSALFCKNRKSLEETLKKDNLDRLIAQLQGSVCSILLTKFNFPFLSFLTTSEESCQNQCEKNSLLAPLCRLLTAALTADLKARDSGHSGHKHRDNKTDDGEKRIDYKETSDWKTYHDETNGDKNDKEITNGGNKNDNEKDSRKTDNEKTNKDDEGKKTDNEKTDDGDDGKVTDNEKTIHGKTNDDDDGKVTDNGKTIHGKTNDGDDDSETDNGKTIHGKTNDGDDDSETDNGKTNDDDNGKVTDNGKTIHGKTNDGDDDSETDNGKTIHGKTNDGDDDSETDNGKTNDDNDGKVTDNGKTIHGKTYDGDDGKVTDNEKTIHGNTNDDDDGKVTDNGKTIHEKTNDDDVGKEPDNGKTSDETTKHAEQFEEHSGGKNDDGMTSVLHENRELDIPKDGVVKIPKQIEAFEEEESSGHFMAYFLTAVVLCIAGYVLYHNKQKITAFIMEGRREARRRRGAGSSEAIYTQIQKTEENAMASPDRPASYKNFVY